MSEPNEQLPDGILDSPDFTCFFSGDRDPVPVKFKVNGMDASITLRAMDHGDKERYALVGVKTRVVQEDGKQRFELDSVDQAARQTFLVLHTLADWSIPTRKKTLAGDEWQNLPAPENAGQREREIQTRFRCTPEAWEWLVGQCVKVNGLDGNTPGN